MKTFDDEHLRSFERLLEDEPDNELNDEGAVFFDTPPDAIKLSIARLQECLPEGARLTLSGVMDHDGYVSDYCDDPMFHIEITLYGGQK